MRNENSLFLLLLMNLLHFLVLFIGSTILFHLTFTFIYSTFSNKFSISKKNKRYPNRLNIAYFFFFSSFYCTKSIILKGPNNHRNFHLKPKKIPNGPGSQPNKWKKNPPVKPPLPPHFPTSSSSSSSSTSLNHYSVMAHF